MREIRHATVLAAGAALLDYAERKMRAGIAAIPDGIWRFEDGSTTTRSPASAAEGRVTVRATRWRCDFDRPQQVRAGINMTWTALLATAYYVVKSVVDPDDPAQCRPGAAAARHGAGRHDPERQPPAAVNGRAAGLPARRRHDARRAGAGRAGAREACSNSVCTVANFIGTAPQDGAIWVYLETIGGGGGARATQGRAGRRACAHHQHLEPAGRGAGDRVPADADALRAGRGFRRRRPVSRRHGAAPGLSAPTIAACASTSPASARSAGACSAAVPAGTARSNAGPGVVFEGDNAVLKAGQWFAMVTPGAGGFGPPGRREPAAAARDLAEGAISPATALGVYGVPARP